MIVETQASVLRAMRAWINIEQAGAARGADIGERTLLDAEKGRGCSEKTWVKLLAFYATYGLHWRPADDLEPGRILII